MPGPVQNFSQSVGEAVVKPVSDEVGKAIEEGVQAITGSNPKPQNSQPDPNLNPQLQAQKQQLEMVKRQNVMRFINQFNTDKRIYEEQKIKEQQKKQQEQQEEQDKKMKVRQLEVVKEQKQQATVAQQQAKSRSERKGGVGG